MTNGLAWVNVQNTAPGNTVVAGAGVVGLPNSVFLHPLAGGAFAGFGTNYFSANPADTSTGRWTSARLIATEVIIRPTGNAMIKQGTLTMGTVPGKTLPYSASNWPIPTASVLRQYPTSTEMSASSIGKDGARLVWIPLDPMDMVFL